MKHDTFGEASDYTEPLRPLHPLIHTLRKRRYELNISQRVLATKLGFSMKALKAWEAGNAEPRIMALYDWAQALGMAVKIEVRDE